MASRYQAIKRLHPNIDFQLISDGTTPEPYIVGWPENIPQPTDAAIQQAMAEIDAEEQAATTAASNLRQQVLTIYVGAVGKRIDQLTAQETRAVVAVMLWRAGGLNTDLTLRAIDAWVPPR